MREYFHRVATRVWYFVTFVLVVLVLFLFFWRLINHDSFVTQINGFLKDINTIFWYLVELSIIIMGIALMVGWRPFRRRNRGH
jgi:hypothetical protein